MNASLPRALLTLFEGLERCSGGEVWPELRERVDRARETLSANLREAGADRFAVDRASLGAVRRVHAARASGDARAASRLLFALLGLPEVRGLAELEELPPESVPQPLSDAQTAAALGAALDVLDELVRASRVAPGDDHSLLTSLNSHAGVHALPSDLRAIAVALEAGQRSFDAFAYYSLRYGDRGRAFTRTDSAWLAAIAEQGVEVTRQVAWLATVLATRGMPTLLLELHLDELGTALSKALPERAHAYQSLLSAAEHLRAARLAALPDAEGRRIELARALAAIPESERLVALSPDEAATLVVAALADARTGCDGAVTSLKAWLTDGDRFPPSWCTAVSSALAG